MSNEVDILENNILQRDPVLLETILLDQSRIKSGEKSGHIFWATDIYEKRGEAYRENAQITVEAITGANGDIVMPRTRKSGEERVRGGCVRRSENSGAPQRRQILPSLG